MIGLDIFWLKAYVTYGISYLSIFTVFALAEMVAFRLLFIFCFSKTTVINESIVFVVLTLFNFMSATLIQGSKILLKEYESNPFIQDVDNEFDHQLHKNVDF